MEQVQARNRLEMKEKVVKQERLPTPADKLASGH